MQIGKVIKEYRTKKAMTQEEMAYRLGVTGSAVGKWENGSSLPDITLVAPIARLLGVSLEELLCFKEDLSKEEVAGLIRELDEKFQSESLDEALLLAKSFREEYPGSDYLALMLGSVLTVQLIIHGRGEDEKWQAWVEGCFRQALESPDESISYPARQSLYQQAFNQGRYEEALSYLQGFSEQDPEKKRRMADIYAKTGKREEAWKTLEGLLLSDYGLLSLTISSLYRMAKEEGDIEMAEKFMEKLSGMAVLFELGRFQQVSGSLEVGLLRKDKDKCFQIIRDTLDSIDTMDDMKKSPLYRHVQVKEVSQEFKDRTRERVRKSLQTDPEYAFLREDPRWKELFPEEEGSKE